MMLATKLLFDRIYDDYYASLFNVIRQKIADKELARDVLQEAFIKIWVALPGYDPLKGGLYTWMATICSNLALDTMRSKHFRKDVVTDQLESKISQINKVNQVFMNIDRLDVRAHVKKLRSLYHEPLLLYSLGYTNSEIGQRLKIPLGTVKSRIRLGLILLRKVWAV